MNVKLAKSAGFCFGVKRAVNMVYDRIGQTDMPIYTYGPIIHNEEVVKDMESKGVHVVEDLSDLATLPKGIIIIRSHGISKSEYDQMQEAGFEIVDATCPFVLKIHRLVREYSMKGHYIIIVGNENHPEVQGIRGWVEKSGVSIIATKEDADNFALPGAVPVTIVSQTTFNYNKFQELVEIITKKGYDINVLNTICNATEERQTEARSIAKESDAMIVIGGKSSSNTQKLFEICKNECANTYYIQTIDDLDPAVLRSIDNVGITAGASTPNKIIEEVQNNVRNEF